MAEVYVDPDASGSNDGTSWTDAYTSIASLSGWTLTENSNVHCRSSSGSADGGTGNISINLATYDLVIEGDFAGTAWDSSAYHIQLSGTYDFPIRITFSNAGSVTIRGIQAETQYREAFHTEGVAVLYEDCLATYTGSNGNTDTHGFVATFDGTGATNCAAIGLTGIGFYDQEDFYTYYCVAVGCNYGFLGRDYRFFTMKNCYAGGNTSGDYEPPTNNPERFTLTTCASSDTSGSSGLQSIAYSVSAGAYFTSVTGGSEDLSIASASSSLIDEGTDLSSDADFPVSDDIEGTARGSSPDIGIFEYVAAGGTTMAAHYYRSLMQGAA